MSNYPTYNQLAWIEQILAPFDEVEHEATLFVNIIKNHSNYQPLSLLHLGCGAGRHDYYFKRHFNVTGVDLTSSMLDLARLTNPEITYLEGDMRCVNLNKKFDVVAIPDSIDYMVTYQDLKQLVKTALNHLNDTCIIFIVCKTKEQYQDNEFIYQGKKDDISIVLHEINRLVSDNTYQAILNYQITRDKKTETITDVHLLGLFNYQKWVNLFKQFNLNINELPLNNLYDQYVQNEGHYDQTCFVVSRQ
jgi:2-polyprenyl-3-methyl-5-hydroxy-6-metoxy-1,4-benzoquinol methylase